MSQASCENYGSQNGTSCLCPPGFGGSTCSQASCKGNLFQGSQRPLVSGTTNLTSPDCACDSGWTGTGCNVCASASACSSALGGGSSSTGDTSGINNTMTCNTTPRVYSSGQLSCQVVNPTLQALYPKAANLNIMRTLDSSLTPSPNVASQFGQASSVFASLFYDGVEQFYCKASSCTQNINSTSTNGVEWQCSSLQCTCRSGTAFCGAVKATDLTQTINSLTGDLGIDCAEPDASTGKAKCNFKQQTLQSLFGQQGLGLDGCVFGECVRQNVIDGAAAGSSSTSGGSSLSSGVIAGLAVVGAIVLGALGLLAFGFLRQRAARRVKLDDMARGGVGVKWSGVTLSVPLINTNLFGFRLQGKKRVILNNVSGEVKPGQFVAILGPSGAGKTTLVEKVLARRTTTPHMTGTVSFPSTSSSQNIQIGFVPQQDVLPPQLTVYEALLFAAQLRLPESISQVEKRNRVEEMLELLGIAHLKNVRIGGTAGQGTKRGISGGEMRRVSIGLELIASPDVLILDEPTSGLDSVSALRVAKVLQSIAHDPERPTAVIASIHQPSSQLYQTFDTVTVLSKGNVIYDGPGGLEPVRAFSDYTPMPQGYNVADYLLEIASDENRTPEAGTEKGSGSEVTLKNEGPVHVGETAPTKWRPGSEYATTFLTQLEVLSGREWKILKRDKTLFLTHVIVSSVLGVFCGGLYYKTDLTIAGFQSRVGCLFFLGALIAFSSLSALYNIVEIRPLFLRERASHYYSPTSWLLSRVIFDVLPLRIVPTILVSTITYWMAGLSHDAAAFFKFLFILVLYTIAMTLFNFLLGTLFTNGGIAILLSALSALYQMTYAGFFVHLNAIPPVLRWLQWLCPLKYTLEALSVNEVGSGLMIVDVLEGVPVNVSAALIMDMLFGFVRNSYYRDVLVLFAFVAGFGIMVVGVVYMRVKER
ncbi:ABC transporter [Flagelloscypha sp. PMI_526]|nr:ABC transporter [Flagelloscypha sp. PMI_526]